MVLPVGAMVSMTVFDLDTGPSGEYVESLTVPEYAYYKTPLRASSGESVTSTVDVNEAARTFTSTAVGDVSDNPTDPLNLTAGQAMRGVQFFFASQDGIVEATFAVSSSSVGCTGSNLLFAGDSPPPGT